MDRFLLEANCSVCGKDLNKPDDETGQQLFLGVGESVDLKCPKCGILWRFCQSIITNQKKINEPRIGKKKLKE